MQLHKLSVKRPVAVTMIVLIFVLIGLYSMSSLSIEMMPEMDLSMAIVMTSYPNVGAVEVENLVTKRVEDALSSVTGVESISSQSSEGVSLVMLEFSGGTDMDKATRDMEEAIDLYSAMLPDGANDPMVIKLDTSAMPIMMMSVSYEGYDLIQTKQFVDDYVKSKIEATEGVASVSISGAQDKVINVTVNPEKMQGYNLSVTDLANAIAAQNINLPAGATEGMNKNLTARTEGEFEGISDIGAVPVMTPKGQIINLSDVAVVSEGFSEKATLARLDGKDAISISVSAESDGNTVEVVNGVIKNLDELKKSYPNFSYNITMESASYIEDAISGVAQSAVIGALLAVIVLILFLGSVRGSLVIGVSMPVSVITTFIGMYFSKMTLNVVSLGGLALGVGMLVDNSVVVLENIMRKRTHECEDAKTAAVSGTGEVIGAVCASVITTCIVYVPILFIDNIMAVMFKQLAFTIVFSQISSLVVTFLLVPMLSSKVKNADQKNKKLRFILEPFDKMMNFLYGKYKNALYYILSRRKRFLAMTLIVFLASIFILGQIGMELMPASDEGTLTVSVSLPAGSKLESTDKVVCDIENRLKSIPEINTIFTNVGASAMSAITGEAENSASISVALYEDRKKTTADVVNDIRNELSDVTGATVSVAASNTAMSMSSDEIQFNFTAANEESLEEYMVFAENLLKQTEGVSETSTSLADSVSEIHIEIDSKKAAMYGMNTATISSFVKGVLGGQTASTLKKDGTEYDIDIVFPENYVKDYKELSSLMIKTNTGQWVSLDDVADVKLSQGSKTLTRVDRKRTVTLSGSIYGSDMGTVNKKFMSEIEKNPMPDGISIVTSGSYEVMIEAMGSLLIAILLGIVLMYMVMAAQFENTVQPFIILFTIPLCIIGVTVSLLVTQSKLSVISMVGILMLMGIIVNNAIILIDFINKERKEKPDEDRKDAIVYSGLARIRPILMTTITSVLGFLPMAVSNASGSEMMAPLAIVLVGGLTIGSLLTLFVIPVIYTIADDMQIRSKAKREKRKAKKEMAQQNV